MLSIFYPEFELWSYSDTTLMIFLFLLQSPSCLFCYIPTTTDFVIIPESKWEPFGPGNRIRISMTTITSKKTTNVSYLINIVFFQQLTKISEFWFFFRYFHVNFGFNTYFFDWFHDTLRKENREYGEDVFGGRGKQI